MGKEFGDDGEFIRFKGGGLNLKNSRRRAINQ